MTLTYLELHAENRVVVLPEVFSIFFFGIDSRCENALVMHSNASRKLRYKDIMVVRELTNVQPVSN